MTLSLLLNIICFIILLNLSYYFKIISLDLNDIMYFVVFIIICERFINILVSKDISEYQQFYKKDTFESYSNAINVQISSKISSELNKIDKYISKAVDLVNSYTSTSNLELAATICFIIDNYDISNEIQIINYVKSWSKRKELIYSDEDIVNSVENLSAKGLIVKDLMRYSLAFNSKNKN